MSYERDPNYVTPAVQIPIPGMRQGVGFGDLVAKMTNALGIRQCAPCKRRQELLNRYLGFGPRK